MSLPSMEEEGVPIASVEQATGIARATLRIWERRYGFPQPGRDARGERSYPDEQVRKLRLIAELVQHGHRPGRLVRLTLAELAALAGPAGEGAAARRRARVDDPVLSLLRNHDPAGLSRFLEDGVRGMGLRAFVAERLAAMNVNVGLAWARGELEVYEEHLYAEAVQGLLRSRIAQQRAAAEPPAAPRVLLATFPGELHGLGLLMAQAMLADSGCACTSLGTRVPLQQIVGAAAAFGADVVGLSFCASMNPTHVLRGLEQLRGELDPEIAIWAGGSSPVLARHRIPGVRPVAHIREVPALVAAWREEREAVA